MPYQRRTIETVYGHGVITVLRNKTYTRKDFTDEAWPYILKQCKTMCRSTNPFNPVEDAMYKIQSLESQDLNSTDLFRRYGRYRGKEYMALIDYVPTKLLRTIKEGANSHLVFIGFKGIVTPEDRYVYFDTARLDMECEVHYLSF